MPNTIGFVVALAIVGMIIASPTISVKLDSQPSLPPNQWTW
jgi:hypothetical protein